MGTIGIRKEDKSEFERRAVVTPGQVQAALAEASLAFVVEPSRVRAFADDEYEESGARLSRDLSTADIILGVKEIPLAKLLPGKAYAYFSHTVKGQAHNMPALKRLMELGCTLIDWEKIVDDKGHRLVFFGYHAGLAGAIDSLWALGQQLRHAWAANPFLALRQAFCYPNLQAACAAVGQAGKTIERHGFPPPLSPFVIGITGYGNVARGAHEVCNCLPHVDVAPEDLESLFAPGADVDPRKVYKVEFHERHTAARKDGGPFQLQEYYEHPELYENAFHRYLPRLSLMLNCIFWTDRYPKLVTREVARELSRERKLRLEVIGDITCDIEGSVEMTTMATTQSKPLLFFNPATGKSRHVAKGKGIAILAVDNLPCELSHDATDYFGEKLGPFLVALSSLDRKKSFEDLDLPPELKRAVIVWNGELTPDYRYLEKHLVDVD